MSRKLTFTILYFDQLKPRYFSVASITSAERTPVKQKIDLVGKLIKRIYSAHLANLKG